MITFISGAPGAGKTSALVSLLSDLSKNRAVYVAGIPDLKIPHQTLDDPLNWFDTVPDGSIIVIDEVQNYWRPTGPGQKIHESITKLETHRHRGLDFYIISQGPNLVHTNVRALIGRHVHLRDIGVLGRWWYEWPECSTNPNSSWKNAPFKKRYKLDSKTFDQYKSASIHVKPIRSFPKMLIVAILAVVATAGLAIYSFSNVKKTVSGPVPSATVSPSSSSPSSSSSGFPSRAVGVGSPFNPMVFVPPDRFSPESAPAYDHLRIVVNMPRVVGGYCSATFCQCFTQQGTKIDMHTEDCRRHVVSPAFDPYRKEPEIVASQNSVSAKEL